MVDDVDALRLALAERIAERDALVQAHEEELARIRTQARDTVLTGALRAEATRQGAHDPDLVTMQIDRATIGWSAEGLPLDVEKAISAARAARGFLFRETAPAEGKGAPLESGSIPKPAAMQGQDARLLSEPDYTARKRQFLAGII
ncbi:phage scaffolding protein [Asaia lannensis]|uniref:Phage scaffolding protein n=1 Tax=Asaia lannensis NBRC 102526 TaxID=1307926 RepID=A0ABT1CKN6_9PROT|nr:phage scaffolding protein [Asaia lannensis]MCO6160809.1 phage scaffolding protein [Asaia lannensis NBRC 102526]GBQ94586.1 hypothetical protein AA102526_0130 [Asaia lannensis NBRC 102526]